MDNENIKTAQVKASKPHLDWNKWDAVISVAIVAFIIIVPLGGIEYLKGRFRPYSIFLDACFIDLFIYLTGGIFIIVFVIVSTVQLLCNWKIYTRRKRLIKILPIGVPFVFIASVAISILTPIETHLWQPGYKAFTYGFRDQVRSKADIESIRDWLRTLRGEDYTGENFIALQRKFPESLKVLRPKVVFISTDENGTPKASLKWGSGLLGAWGVVIGMEDMEIPPSDFSQRGVYTLPVEPGVYVWYGLD